MIFRKILPSQGGGALRRYLQIRQDILQKQYPKLFSREQADTTTTNNPQNNSKNDVKKNEEHDEDRARIELERLLTYKHDDVVDKRIDYKQEEAKMMQEFQSHILSPLTIIDFTRVDDAADARRNCSPIVEEEGDKKEKRKIQVDGWRISDDEVIGGFSRADLVFHETSSSSSSSNATTTNETDSIDIPHLQWKGVTNTQLNTRQTRGGKKYHSRARKSGFCAIRSPEFKIIPLFHGVPIHESYNALEIVCREHQQALPRIQQQEEDSTGSSSEDEDIDSIDADTKDSSLVQGGRSYTVNLKLSTYFEDDLYQLNFCLDEPEATTATKQNSHEVQQPSWKTVILPLESFFLTSGGVMKENQRKLDTEIIFQHFGITLMDERDGPFQLDLARIRVVHYSTVENKILLDD